MSVAKYLLSSARFEITLHCVTKGSVLELDGSPDVPSFIYQVTAGREVPGHGYHYMLDPGNSTEVFYRTIAMGTMSSSLTIAESTSPTLSPSVPGNTPSGGEVNGSFMSEPGALLLVGTIYLLRLFV